jgi:lysozyme
MTKTLLTDSSHWEGTINWSLAAPAMGGCINKATEHVSFVDDQWANNKAGCIAQGEPYGAYHFFRPAYDPILQAQHFIRTVGSGVKVFACDVETAILELYKAKFPATQGVMRMAAWPVPGKTINLATTIIAEIINREIAHLQEGTYQLSLPELVEKFLDYVISHVPDCRPVFYSSPYFWIEHMKYPDGSYPNWNGRYHLWLAHYYVNEPQIPAPWTGYLIHQYTDKLTIPGIESNTDGDWFKGDQNAVNEFFGNAGIPVPPSLPDHFHINSGTVNIRSTPDAKSDNSNVIGTTTQGKQWQPLGISLDNQGREWWQINPRAFVAKWLTIW